MPRTYVIANTFFEKMAYLCEKFNDFSRIQMMNAGFFMPFSTFSPEKG